MLGPSNLVYALRNNFTAILILAITLTIIFAKGVNAQEQASVPLDMVSALLSCDSQKIQFDTIADGFPALELGPELNVYASYGVGGSNAVKVLFQSTQNKSQFNNTLAQMLTQNQWSQPATVEI